MKALIYVLVVFAALLVLFIVQASTGLHVFWIFGVILSYPAFWMLCRSLRLIALAVSGRRAAGEVIAVRGRDNGILRVRYQDAAGTMHEAEERAVYGILIGNHPPQEVTVHYFRRFPKHISFGWRTMVYWLPIDLFWIAFTILCWVCFTGWLV